MDIPRSHPEKFSYADYFTLEDRKRSEIIDGIAFDMSPAPGTKHPLVHRKLFNSKNRKNDHLLFHNLYLQYMFFCIVNTRI